MKHIEELAKQWAFILDDSKKVIPLMQVIAAEGGTRPAWMQKDSKNENMLLAWPKQALMRASMIVGGEVEGKLNPKAVLPLLEGIPNTLRVEASHAWKNGVEGAVAAAMPADNSYIWFYDPLFFRDKVVDLTEGVEQPFYIAGLCYTLRKALLDELTITNGPDYEAYAQDWLLENQGKTRLDVPALKIDLRGKNLLMPDRERFCDYEGRCVVQDVEEFVFADGDYKTEMYRLMVTFGQKSFLHIMMYAPKHVCYNGYVPQKGDDIDLKFWMQGRIADVDEATINAGNAESANPADLATEATTPTIQ